MEYIDIAFGRPVAGMVFSCCGEVLVARERNTQRVRETAPQNDSAAIELELLARISEQLSTIQEDLNTILPQIEATAIEFVESFVGLLFQCDSELAQEKIMSNLKTVFSDGQMGAELTVHLNPDMVERIRPQLESIPDLKFQIAEDPLLELADCRIEGGGKAVIARIRRQIEVAKNHWWSKKNEHKTIR